MAVKSSRFVFVVLVVLIDSNLLVYAENNQKCGKNEEFQQCGSECPETCQNRCKYQDVFCIQVCAPGCVCREGFIRDLVSQKCLRKNACPSCECDSNETYTRCGASCVVTCQNRFDPPYCPSSQSCTEGCICDQGFIKDTVSGECVKENECPNEINENYF